MSFLMLPILAWLAYAIWFYRWQDRLVFTSPRRIVSLVDAGLADFTIAFAHGADGSALEAWYRAADGLTKPTILLLHGTDGHPVQAADRARALADAGYGVLLAGFRGVGPNDGHATEAGWIADAGTWADYLVARGISGGRLVLYGRGAGAAMATQLAAERAVSRLILEAPFADMADRLAQRWPFLPCRALLRHHFDLRAFLPQVQAPILILSAGTDTGPAQAIEPLVTAALHLFRRPQATPDTLIADGGMAEILAFLAGKPGTAPPVLDLKAEGGRALTIRR